MTPQEADRFVYFVGQLVVVVALVGAMNLLFWAVGIPLNWVIGFVSGYFVFDGLKALKFCNPPKP